MEEIVLKAITQKEISPQEREKLDSWLKESQKNRMIYNQLKLTIKYPSPDRIKQLKVEGLAKLNHEIALNGVNSSDNGRSLWSGRILKIAAAIVFMFSVSMIIYKSQQLNPGSEQSAVMLIEKTSLPGQKVTITLSDGTIVKLNSDSKIIAPDHFSEDIREVELIGEAFFDVNRDTRRPFIIKTSDLKVEVLGTSFIVRSYNLEGDPRVAVKTGKVAVNKISGSSTVYLTPNEMSVLNKGGDLSKKVVNNEDLIFGWTEQKLVFEEALLENVFHQVERWFGVEIILEKPVNDQQRPYTANYSNPTLDEVLKSLAHLYQFEYEKDGNRILVRE